MGRQNPLHRWLAPGAVLPLFLVLTLALIGSTVCLYVLDQFLITPAAPRGIVSFELARNAEVSRAILASWSEGADRIALLIQGIDYLYLVVYPLWLAFATALTSLWLGGFWKLLGRLTSLGVLLAAPLDAVENYALIQQLLYGADAVYASLAWWCAVPKFVLVGWTATFLLIATLARLFYRLSSTT